MSRRKLLTPDQVRELSERLESLGPVIEETAGMIRGVDWTAQGQGVGCDVLSLQAGLRTLADLLQEVERGRVRVPGQRGRPVIHRDDPAERERFRVYLESGMGSRAIEKTGQETCSRDTINEKLKRYSEELGIERKTQFAKGRKWPV